MSITELFGNGKKILFCGTLEVLFVANFTLTFQTTKP
jgi:hypothetical protein